jgi:hypothetical protein
MKVSTIRKPAAPALFASVRSSRDLSLVAFATALLAAFALHAGAFVPRLSPAGAPRDAAAPVAATPVPAAATAAASQLLPCGEPRG